MDGATRDYLDRKFDMLRRQEQATRAAVVQTLDVLEELAADNESFKARVTRSKRAILASIARVDATLEAEDDG